MAKDNAAVRNQKVFIALEDVIAVLNEYHRLCNNTGDLAKSMATAANSMENFHQQVAKRKTIEWVLDTLSIPREGKL